MAASPPPAAAVPGPPTDRGGEAALGARAQEIERSMREIRDASIETAAAVQAREAEIAAAVAEIAAIDARRRTQRAAWLSNRTSLARLLAGLALVARNPPGAATGRRAEWADTARGVALIERVLPALKTRVDTAAAEAAGLERLRAERAERAAALSEAQTVLVAEQTRLRRLLERKSSAQASLMVRRRAAAVDRARRAGEADDMRGLMERLAVARPRAAAPAPGGGEADGGKRGGGPAVRAALPGSSLPWPVHGTVTTEFGDDTDGGASPGLFIEAPPGAQVVAPGAGEIVFAGPFRRYGRLLIIEHGDGYHSLMSGFARIDGRVGQVVRAGEPVGVMANAGGGGATILYVEVRRGRRPVDPMPWLLSDSRKVSG